MNTLQRIKEFIDFKGIKVKHFEEMIGFSNGAFASQLKNGKTIGVDKLENILFAFPDVNPDWLLSGQGNMLRQMAITKPANSTTEASNHTNTAIPHDCIYKELFEKKENEVKELSKEIGRLEAKNKYLREQLAEKNTG